MMEVWRPIPGVAYEASSDGRVRNSKTGRVLRTSVHAGGYENVQIRRNGSEWTAGVHQFVALAFHGQPPTPEYEVAHADGDRLNNAEDNLSWVTHLENMRDRDRHGTTARGERNGKLVYPPEVVAAARAIRAQGATFKQVAAITGVSVGYAFALCDAKSGRRPAHSEPKV
jgi:hypothetical protein